MDKEPGGVELMNVNIPNWSDVGYFMPEAILCLTFLAALLADLIARGRHAAAPFLVTLAGTLLALGFAVADIPQTPQTILGDLVVIDTLTILKVFKPVIQIFKLFSCDFF